jgi:polysaccharide export outer membrane protein
MKFLIKTLTLNLCLLIFANVYAQDKTVTPEKPEETKVVKVSTESNEKKVNRDDTTGNGRYRIGINDLIEVQVFRHPELNQVYRVDRDGVLRMARLDNKPISVLCKTEAELAKEITESYKSYLRNPFVTVIIREYTSQPIAVIGAVEKPGQFFVNRRIRLLDALGFAGGPNKEAGARILVARLGTVSFCEQEQNTGLTEQEEEEAYNKKVFRYTLRKTMEGDETSNPWMQPGDVVSILEAEEAYVVGNVKEPTSIKLKEPITLTEAIAKAGGILPATKTKAVLLVRRDPVTLEKKEITVNLDKIRKKEEPDITLQANDIVGVEIDNVKELRRNILKALTGGIGNIFLRVPLP